MDAEYATSELSRARLNVDRTHSVPARTAPCAPCTRKAQRLRGPKAKAPRGALENFARAVQRSVRILLDEVGDLSHNRIGLRSGRTDERVLLR